MRIEGLLAFLVAPAVFSVVGCGLIPSHESYEIGVARIGDTYHVFAPLCEDERITQVVVYDNEAAGRAESYDPDSEAYDYWKVRKPSDEDAARGWLELGDDAAFREVDISAGSNVPFPDNVGVELDGTAPGGGYFVSDVFYADDVPTYPAGADPRRVKYGFHLTTERQTDLTAEEISEQSKCAREYFY